MRYAFRRLVAAAAAAFVAAGTPGLAATPDITGPWQVAGSGRPLVTAEGKPPPLLPAARAAQATRMAQTKKEPDSDPIRDCLPPGVPRLMTLPWPFNIVQGKRTIAMMFEWNHLTRLIYMDRGHFEPIGPLYLGQSVGKWEGDTLVVHTNSYNDVTWLDDFALSHSDEMTTTERIRLVNGGTILEDRITIEDPKTYSSPWTARILFRKKAGVLIKEDYCLGRMNKGGTPSK